MMFFAYLAIGVTALSFERSENEAVITQGTNALIKSVEHDFQVLQTVLTEPERWLGHRRSTSFLETDPAKNVHKLVSEEKKVVPKKMELNNVAPKKEISEAPAKNVHKLVSAEKVVPKKMELNNVAPKKEISEAESVNDMVNKVKNVPVTQMPLLLGFMEDMYERFKHNIARATKLEEKSKAMYKKNLAEKAKWPESYLKDKAMMNLAGHWDKQRELSHRHYHNMLKLSHAGMARIKVAMDMMKKAIAGQALDNDQMAQLKEMAPQGLFLQLQDIVSFCSQALSEIHRDSIE